MKRALISVYHKEAIDGSARLLAAAGWQIISTGGTAQFLQDHGIPSTDVAALTGFPEILDGRVKTLHPHVFGPILAKATPEHLGQLERFKLGKIDLVMVNFYPFEESLPEKEKGQEFMTSRIDIGGPSMVRAAAKNFAATTVVVDPADYLAVAEALARDGEIPIAWRRQLAQKAFAYTSFYDSLIAEYLRQETLPPYRSLSGRKVRDLRYGENPHQAAALYSWDRESPFHSLQPLQGKELSFNNILDASMVYELLGEFPPARPFAAIIKHQNPCGAALGDSLEEAFGKALAADPKSAYGGIIGLNQPLDEKTASAIGEVFFEVIVAPAFTPEALALLKKRKNLRLLQLAPGYREKADIRIVPGGFLFQERDHSSETVDDFFLKTSRPLTPQEKRDAAFGWKMIKFVKSNAIIIVKDEALIGVGAGQMSRVDSVEIALRKSLAPLAGAVLASDGFFPFADSIEAAADRGITVAIEPGGSVKDEEVIAAARARGLSLLFTGVRHFRH